MSGVFTKSTASVQIYPFPGPDLPFNFTREGANASLNSWDTINARTLTTIISPSTYDPAFSNGPYRSLILGVDGKLYSPPWLASHSILVIDPTTDTASIQGFGLSGLLFDIGNYVCGALAANGKIYCPPYSHNQILIIDTVNGTTTLTNLGVNLSATAKYTTCVVGPDGKIYCPGRTNCLIIDPSTNTATTTTFGGVITATTTIFRWGSGVRSLADDKLYFAPLSVPSGQTASHVLIINTTTQTAVLSRFGTGTTTAMSRGMTYGGIANGPDGLLILSPFGRTNAAFGTQTQHWTVINPIGGSSVDYNLGSTTANTVLGCIAGDDQIVYGAPYVGPLGATNKYLFFKNDGPVIINKSDFGVNLSLAGTSPRWWGGCLAGNGKMYTLPDMSFSAGNNNMRRNILILDVGGNGHLTQGFRDLIDTSYFNKGGT